MKTNIYTYLFEQEEQNQKQAPEANVTTKPTEKKVKASDDSVDDQIDALILKYENSGFVSRFDFRFLERKTQVYNSYNLAP